MDTSLFAQQRSALTFANSNQYVAYKALTPDAMGMAPYPKVGPDGKGGLYIKPSQFFSVSSQSKLPDESVKLINFLLTDPGATAILGRRARHPVFGFGARDAASQARRSRRADDRLHLGPRRPRGSPASGQPRAAAK